MAEKLLKAYCISLHETFPKIHQLDALVNLISKKDENISDISIQADILTGFYTTTRYPGDYEEYTWKDAEEAFGAAKEISVFVLERILA